MSPSAPDTDHETARRLALLATLVVVGTVLTVFYGLTSTFGGTPWLVLYVALAFAAATIAARRTPTRVGLLGAGAVLVVGLLGYVVLLPSQYYGLFTASAIFDDLAGWLTGRSVWLMLAADLWAISVAPAPVFLTWYLALRGRYDAAALAGGAAMGFFVLTGNLDDATTLVGMAGLLAMVGFGAVATADGSWRQIQEVGLVVGLVLLLTRVVQVVPASSVGGLAGRDGGGGRSLEGELLSNPDRMQVGGRPTLTATPRYTVRAEEQAYWHARSFDHYGGQQWRRTDRALGAERPLDPPPSTGTTLQQSFTVESPTGSMPAAWKPVLLASETRTIADVGDAGNLEPASALEPGSTYEVISEVPSWTEETLAVAGTDYPPGIEERYTQLPNDLPDRLVTKADEITADARGPYETALAVQEWLGANKGYSLGVDRSNWDIADAFVFALESGYCVYFATTMAVLLRTQGIPARFVVGYAPGEQVDDGEWLVRGYHSHAWVEVYFDGVGWVTFDPTPSGPRQRAQQRERERARAAVEEGTPSGTPASPTPTPTEGPTPSPGGGTASNGTERSPTQAGQLLPGEGAGNGSDTSTPTEADQRLPGAVQSGGTTNATATPAASARGQGRDRLWLLGVLATVAFGSVRLGYAQSAFREVWLRYQPRSDDPDRDVERALDRLAYHLESRFRAREEGETWQHYLAHLEEHGIATLDDRAWRVLAIYHRSRYGGGVDRERADEAVRVVNDVVR